MKTVLRYSLGLLLLFGLSACNTVRGFGEDISALGRALSNSTGTAGGTH